MTSALAVIHPRATAPDPAVEYFLDCARQAGEMDACTEMAVRLYGDDAVFVPLIGRPVRRMPTWRQRAALILELGDMADRIIEPLPPARRAGLAQVGLRSVVDEMLMLAETFSNWAINDEVEGGNLLNFRDRPRARKGVTFKNTDRRLRSPRFIRRYVKQHADEADHLQALSAMCVRRARAWGAVRDGSMIEDLQFQLRHKQQLNIFADRKREKADRRVILRSLKQATAIVGPEPVRAFLRGEEVRLVGREAILAVRKRAGLADRGVGCLSVGLLSRDGTTLADLCTYVEDTPTLDQLSAFALWMISGEERAVLETANVTSISEVGRGHPLVRVAKEPPLRAGATAQQIAAYLLQLGDITEAQANRIAEVMTSDRKPHVRQLTHEQQRARNEAYWEETKGHWIEAMVVLVIGYKNLKLFKAAGAL